VRLACRTYFANARILSRIAQDLAWIFQESPAAAEPENGSAIGSLWDSEQDAISGGKNYGDEPL
ncbi:MAG: type I-E CRISPR-associated endonuclease Cas1, partial [Butyricicoccus sp.]